MADELLQILLEIAVDEQAAKAAQARIEALDKATTSAEKAAQRATMALRQMAERGEKMRNIGAVMAGIGVAITGPMVAATNIYLERYKNLEGTANRYNAALQRQQDATTRLGRSFTSVLTPGMQTVADILEKLASFAEAHPDLVKIAAIGGLGIGAAGGALMMAGTAISSIARAAELLKNTAAGSAIGTAGKAVVILGAMAAASEVTVLALNELGKATDDQRLANYQLVDTFKTGRELIAASILALAKAFYLGRSAFEDLLDELATGVRGLSISFQEIQARFANSVLDAIASLFKRLGLNDQAKEILKGKDYRVGGAVTEYGGEGNAVLTNVFETQRQLEQKGLKDRQGQRETDYHNALANLADAAKSLGAWAETGQFQTGTAQRSKGPAAAGADNQGLVAAYMARQRAIIQSEKQFNLDMLDLKKGFNQANEKAERDYQTALKSVDIDEGRGRFQAQLRWQRSSAQARDEFYSQTLQIQKRRDTEAAQRLKTHNQRLFELEGERDVAGYLAEMRNFANQEDANGTQNRLEDEERRDQARKEQDQRDEAYRQELDDLAEQARTKREDLADNYRREKNDRQAAYDDQLGQLRDKHQREKDAIDVAFAEQVAQLTGNFAGLNAMYGQYYTDMNQAALDFVNQQRAHLRELYGGSTGTAPGFSMEGSSAGMFATGTLYVPKTSGGYHLNRGEAVLNQAEAAAYRGGQSGRAINLTVNLATASLASKADLQQATDQIVQAVSGTLENAGIL